MEQTEQVLQTEDTELCASVALSQGINTHFLNNQRSAHQYTPTVPTMEIEHKCADCHSHTQAHFQIRPLLAGSSSPFFSG